MNEFLIRRIFTILFVIVGVTGFSQQVIHIENRRMADPEEGFSGNISAELNLVQNLSNTLGANGMGQLFFKKRRSQWLSISALNLMIFNDERIRNDGYQHLRYNYELNERWSPEAFVQYQYNEWLKIGFRSLHGAGMRMTVLDNDSAKTKIFAGLSYMHEYEEETTGKFFRGHRANLYVSLGLPVGKLMHFDAIAYFQPNILWIGDIRSSIQMQLQVSITNRLSLLLAYSFVYDGAPPEGVPNVFYDLKNGLRFNF